MPLTVNIAFSGGIESTYLLQRAMEGGFDVNLAWINVSGNKHNNLGELRGVLRTINYFRKMGEEGKGKYPGSIRNIFFGHRCPYQPMGGSAPDIANSGVSQQYAVVLGMMDVITGTMRGSHHPSTWIGWLEQDTVEFTHNEFDFSKADYNDLLNINVKLGWLNGSNRIGKGFHAPLWKRTKKEIWDMLDPALQECVVPNGTGADHGESKWVHTPFAGKVSEYQAMGIPIKSEYVTYADYESDDDLFARALCGMVSWVDLKLPHTAQAIILDTPAFRDNTRLVQFDNEKTTLRARYREAVIKRIHKAKAVELDPSDLFVEREKSYEA